MLRSSRYPGPPAWPPTEGGPTFTSRSGHEPSRATSSPRTVPPVTQPPQWTPPPNTHGLPRHPGPQQRELADAWAAGHQAGQASRKGAGTGALVGVALGCLFVGGWLGTAVGSAGDTASAPPTPNLPERTATASAPAQASTEAPTGVPDGVWSVGEDIDPGRWKTPGPLRSDVGCSWSIDTAPNGGDTVDRGYEKGQAYVELEVGQYFKATGCQPWQPA